MSFRPPFIDIQNNIIRSFIEGHQLSLEKQKLAQDKELRQQQLEQEKERIANEHEYQQGHLSILKSASDLNRLIQGQGLMEKGGETGIYPAGTEITPSNKEGETLNFPGGQGQLDLGVNKDQIMANIPGLGQFQGLTPEAQATRMGQLGISREAPLLQKQKELQQEISDRQMATELIRLESQNQIKQIEMNAGQKRSETGAAARKYAADTAAQASIKRAEIMANKRTLTASQQTHMDNLQDIEDAVKEVQKSLGNPEAKDNRWNQWFTSSPIDEVGRTHPTLGKLIGGVPDELSDVNAKISTLENVLAQKQKYSPAIQNLINQAGLNGSRSQTAKQARDNFDTFLGQIRKEKENMGRLVGDKVSITEPAYKDRTIVTTPDGDIKFPDEKSADAFRQKHDLN